MENGRDISKGFLLEVSKAKEVQRVVGYSMNEWGDMEVRKVTEVKAGVAMWMDEEFLRAYYGAEGVAGE